MTCVALISLNACGIKTYSYTRKKSTFSVLTKSVFIKYCLKCSNRQPEIAIAVYLLRSHMLHFINASGIL